jgi:hypothetical protein
MAIFPLFKKAAIVAIGLVLLRSYAEDGICTVVWEEKGFPNYQPIPSIFAESIPILGDQIHLLPNSYSENYFWKMRQANRDFLAWSASQFSLQRRTYEITHHTTSPLGSSLRLDFAWE